MDNVTCYGQIKGLTLNDNSVSAKVEIELERGLIDDLMDLKRRGQFRLVLEPFQKRLGETAMAEIRAFAEAHPYVRVEVPASGCDHPPEAQRLGAAGTTFCVECGEVFPEPEPADGEAQMTSRAEDEAADNARADAAEASLVEAEAQFGALAETSRNSRRAPATPKEATEQDEAAERLAHTSSP